MTKIFFFLLTLFVCCFPLTADNVTTLKVWHIDGSVSSYTLSESTRISFEHAEMCYSEKDWSVNVPLAEIKTWTYDVEKSGIENISMTPSEIHISQTNGHIMINGVRDLDSIKIFASDGMCVREAICTGNTLVIDASAWPQGVYIIMIGNKSHKIIKR